ncbi:hypothetical protein Esi_0028_0107 [Ectocarpus siliculosus]|uniref:Uncharacterized protein n=1 Tax=Ectocarpus siliculosus TaxID=2880 RepID=D8LK27_ECTSI|nr:hypothetical protein Esi_0028_0107 [Ectocarpus siliculosus]|eukprot:CBN74496.1 hypothetical protein Esi_0028_0107 [Ectocarpus siliculosus]
MCLNRWWTCGHARCSFYSSLTLVSLERSGRMVPLVTGLVGGKMTRLPLCSVPAVCNWRE